ncbi:MAG: SapC family protein [Pseudomonadota bacterium]|nr:SapC family protein [Pseudomonadota bacterium]MEC7684887.1 SapC family protein [Pseudomonadota bacterium]MEC7996219.1 SapC family protein [Pseudomonadota bacterium]MEC8408347.1 SapC family protein [Pseudomonadota bacterium]MEC8453713.1 SapC family protein [Pseudomonadota bacterium]
MSKFVPLAKDQHAKLRVIQSGDYTRYRQQNLIPIVVRDFFTLSAEFPLVFVTNESTEDFMPVAIMGLQEGKNIYCQEEPFPAQVIPVGFGNAPFAITATDEKREQFAVLIDEESSLLSESEGDRVFTDDGEKTEYMEARVEGLVQAAQQHHQTQEITKYLVEKSLLTTQQVRLQHRPDGRLYNIDGIHVVDEQKFNELSDEDFLDMRSRGLVALVYAHLNSLQQLRRVSERQYAADKAAEATESEESS